MPLPPVAERFLRYVQIDTQSDPDAVTTPSTEKQKDLGRLLAQELRAMGLADAHMDDYGYVFATIPHTLPPPRAARTPVLALLAHVDTSPDAPGAGVRPLLHRAYDGGVLRLPGDPSVTLDPARQPALLDHLGHDLITSDGTTLLGSDDKAGVAILMQLAENLVADRAIPCPTLRLCFTVYPKSSITLDVKDQYKNMRAYIDAADPRVVTFAHGAAREMGIALKEAVVRGGTDGARLSELGIPTPNVFNGGHDYHSCFEWNSVQNLELSLAFTTALVRYWAEHGAA